MENMPWVFCGRMERHGAHGDTCPGTGRCGDRTVHEPHLMTDGSLAPLWCFGDRVRLYRERHVSTDRRLLRSTTWVKELLPVMTADGQDHFDTVVVGTLTAVRRESATGWVTGLIETARFNPSGLHAEADFDSVEYTTRDDGVMVTTAARLRAVTLGGAPCWDEMRIP